MTAVSARNDKDVMIVQTTSSFTPAGDNPARHTIDRETGAVQREAGR